MPDGLVPVFNTVTSGQFEAIAPPMLAARVLRLDKDRFRAGASKRVGPTTELWLCDYGSPVVLAFSEGDYVRVQIPVSGCSITEDGSRSTAVGGQVACISRGSATLAFETGFKQYAWRIPVPSLVRKLSALIGEPVIRAIEFDPVLDLDLPLSRRLVHLIRGLLEIPGETTNSIGRIADEEAEQAMVATLLVAASHNYRNMLESQARQSAPRQVRAVERYIEEHWNEPVDYETLVALSGVSIRSLFRTFKSFRGYTPMEFAKGIRLQKAREMLLSCPVDMTVSSVAYACGFPNLSAFSRDFAAAYGSPPSKVRRPE